MNQYLYLIFKVILRGKLYSLKNVFNFFDKLSFKSLAFVWLLISLFKLFCSAVSILVLEELFVLFKIHFLLPYIIILLVYVFSMEEVEKHNFFLKKLKQYYLGSLLSQRELAIYFIALPNLINLLFKLDTILPFLLFSIFLSNPIFIAVTILTLLYAILRNSYKTIMYIMDKKKEESPVRKIVSKIIFLALSLFIADKVFRVVAISIQSMKEIFTGFDYSSINSRFEEKIHNLIPNFELFLNIDKNIYLILLLIVFLINTFNYIINIDRLLTPEKSNIKNKYNISHLKVFKYTKFSKIEKLLLQQISGMRNTFLFLVDNTEIIIIYYFVYLICDKTNNLYVKMYIFLAFFMIGNSNIINSFVVKHSNFFKNHNDIPAIIYWKISERNIVDLYKIKKAILEKLTLPLVIEHVFVSYVVAIAISNNVQELIIYTVLHTIFFGVLGKVIRFNSMLSTFMVPLVFSRFYQIMKTSATSEYEVEMYNKIYNFYKFPMVALTLLPLMVQIFVNIFNIVTLFVLVACLGVYFLYIRREEDLLVEKGESVYEKLNI